MTTIVESLEYWHDRVQQDLAPFADPGTPIQIALEGRSIRAKWTMRSETYEAVFVVSVDSGAMVAWQGQQLSYRSFFASSEMADLVGLAKMILQAAQRSVFVDTPARIREEQGDYVAPATALLRETLTEAQNMTATVIVIVTGDAGAGKTSVLQELVRRCATAFIAGKSDRVFLYVNAQGRALARLEEALATELSDLRARLTYHAVPTVTRLGLLVPVIDGFDELLGVSGYDEAFSSLSRFVEDLNGEGQIVASARSTYYEQEFAARANSVSSLGAQIWQQIPVQVLEWGPAEVNAFFDAQVKVEGLEAQSSDLRRAFDRAFSGDNERLRTKPFFVSRVLRLAMDNETFEQPGELLELLVRAYADREVSKLQGRSGESLVNRAQIIELLEEMAEEMWNEESRELDQRSTRDVAEFTLATQGVSESVQRYVIQRMSSMAFLTPGARKGHVAFEHESFFAFFLGTRLSERLETEATRLHSLLGRSAMPEQVAGVAAHLAVIRSSAEEVRALLSRLSNASGIESTRSAQVRENAGLLAAVILRLWCHDHDELADATLEGVVIPGSDLTGVTLRAFTLTDVELRRVDLTHARFLESRFQRGRLHEVIVDPVFTRLEFDDFDPSSQLFGLRVLGEEGIRAEYDPVRVRETLAACGMEHLAAPTLVSTYRVRPDIVDMVERVVRAYYKSNPISVNEEEPRTSKIWRLPDWPRVEQLLIESGVVRPETKSTSGSKKVFLRRRVLAGEIVAGMDPTANVAPAVRQFWQRLAREFAEI